MDKALKCFSFPDSMIEAFKLGINSQPFPNPKVGAVVTDKYFKIKSKGYHKGPGFPHAEIDALKNVEINPDDILFVTLEPCFHSDTSPSCASEIIKYGIKNIYYGGIDQDIRTNGKSIQKLNDNKVKTILVEGVNELLNPHYINQKINKKKVTYIGKLAVSSDNFIYSEKNRYISNKESLVITHILRANINSILIGKNTFIIDNPLLDTRFLENLDVNLNPLKFVLWGNDKNILNFIKEDFIFLTNFSLEGYKNIVNIGNLTFKNINDYFKEIDNFSVLIEGGNKIHEYFLKNNSYDNFYLFKSSNELGDGLKITREIDLLNVEKYSNKEIQLIDNTLNIYTRY